MGRSKIDDDDWDLEGSSNASATVVLVGTTGNGKSATGNSILGRKAFVSRASSSGITSTCEMQSTVLRDGRILNVIDTPGLFDYSAGSHFIGKEIVKCMKLAKDGIHAVIVVLSVRSRFSREEEESLKSLQAFFGDRMLNYMIVVFTGGDELEDSDETLEDYLGRECPEPLQRILFLCKNRMVLFNNKTKDERKRLGQVNKLLSLVDLVIASNGGAPYSDDVLAELKKGAIMMHDKEREVNSLHGYSKEEIAELKEQIYNSHEHQLQRITEMMELKLKEYIERLEAQLAEEHAARLEGERLAQELLAAEQAARLEAEKHAQDAHSKSQDDIRRSNDEIRKLRESLEKAQKESEEFRKQAESKMCHIL